MKKKLPPSEMEASGPKPFGGFGIARAWEKLRLTVRTGQNPDSPDDLNAEPDDWGTGGLRSPHDKL